MLEGSVLHGMEEAQVNGWCYKDEVLIFLECSKFST